MSRHKHRWVLAEQRVDSNGKTFERYECACGAVSSRYF